MHIVKLQFLPPVEEKKKLQHLLETHGITFFSYFFIFIYCFKFFVQNLVLGSANM
jgi:hypothetical protein